MPRVSVLLPCRDAAAYASEAVASLLAQTYADFEILAVDDASTDDTPEILHSWARSDPRVHVLASACTGIVDALNVALAHASGEIIARMDADDVAEPCRLALQVSALDGNPALAACGCRVRYFPRDHVREGAQRYEAWINALVRPEQLWRDRFIECPVAHPALVLRRRALEAVGGYRDPGWPEDYDLVLRLFAAGHALCNVPDVLLHWRERTDRLSRTDPRYGEDAFRRCKVHYLLPLLRSHDGVVVWGAGPVGKGFARELAAHDVAVRAFVELDPRKIGQRIHGAPVVAPAAINDHRGAFALAAVSGAQARSEIRASLAAAGWREGADFLAVA